jgi:O-Antigen ligase
LARAGRFLPRGNALTLGVARALATGPRHAVGSATRQAAAVVAFASVFGLAISQGGYFPTSWGWASVPLLWIAAIALVLRSDLCLSRPERLFLAALASLTAWIAASTIWSVAPAESVLETQRALIYLAAAVSVLAVTRSSSTRLILAGLLAAIALVAVFSLATRLLPDRFGVYDGFGVYRLAEPIGYRNGLGAFVAMGAILAVGFAARAQTPAVRGACAAIPVLLLPTLYFTFGRSAWIALAAGLLAAIAVDPHRLQLLATIAAIAPWPALAIFIASREPGLTHIGSALPLAAHDGHRVALATVALTLASAVAGTTLAVAERRIRIGRIARRRFALTIATVVFAATAIGLIRYGGPVQAAKTAYASVKAPRPNTHTDLNQRLLSLSGNGRIQLWRLAWDDAARHPVLGSGAGTYERYFLAHQPADTGRVRDAHSLYLETLAELGPIGLALLIAFLLSPVLMLGRARHQPLVPAALGAYLAYVVHAGVDWDWELPAITLVAVFCACAIALAGRSTQGPPPPLSPTLRWSMTGLAAVAAAFATIALIGNTALARSEKALGQGNQTAAAADARRARELMPWSPQPWDALGRAQQRVGLTSDARRSFRKAVSIDGGDWELWYDLAAVSTGVERTRSLAKVALLYPRSGLVPSKQ